MTINAPAQIHLPATQPRAVGEAALKVKHRDTETHVASLVQRGSLKLLFPHGDRSAMTAVLLNTAGGVTGGDRFQTKIHAGETCRLVMTTQAAERAYRAQPDETGSIRTELSMNHGARLDWLPQETILFQGASLRRSLRLSVAEGASGLIVEPVIFGRKAMGEVVTDLSFHDRIDIEQGGKLLYSDRTRIDGNAARTLSGRATGQGAGAMATLVYVGPDADLRFGRARDALPAQAGVSMPRDGLICTRLLAEDGFALRQKLIPLISVFRDTPDLPRTWMI